MALPAAAQTAPPPPAALSDVYACAARANDAERLSCYDAAVGRLRSAQTAGELVAVDRAQAQQIEREAFGFALPSLPRLFGGGQAEAAALEVAAVISGKGQREGRGAFVLDNGQVWVQTEGVSGRHVRVGDRVLIRSGAVGGYMLSPQTGRALRVRRAE